MTHTKGEWKIDKQSETIYSGDHHTNISIVCQLFDKFDHDFENKEANAQLISAAPDMYEALEGLMDAYRQEAQEDPDKDEDFKKAKQALKKAKGESQ